MILGELFSLNGMSLPAIIEIFICLKKFSIYSASQKHLYHNLAYCLYLNIVWVLWLIFYAKIGIALYTGNIYFFFIFEEVKNPYIFGDRNLLSHGTIG